MKSKGYLDGQVGCGPAVNDFDIVPMHDDDLGIQKKYKLSLPDYGNSALLPSAYLIRASHPYTPRRAPGCSPWQPTPD